MTDNTAPAEDNIRADIEAAMKASAPDPASQPEPQTTATEQALSQPQSERARDEAGKFKQAEAAKPDKVEETVQAANPSPIVHKAPESWTAPMKERFKAMSPEDQAYIVQREGEVTKKLTAQDDERSFGRRVKETLTPYMAIIQQEGGTPEQAIGELMRTAAVLRSPNLAVRRQALQTIAQQFNVDLSLPLQQGGAQQQGLDPAHVERLVQAEMQKHQQEQEDARVSADLRAFISAPGHEHYETVRPIMRSLLLSEPPQANSFEDAYEKAVWMVPEIRSTLSAAQTQANEQKRITEAQAKADAAKRAAGSVVGAPGANQPLNGAAHKDLSLRDELKAAYSSATSGRA